MAEAANDSRITARILLEIQAVDFRPVRPFRHTSGRLSPSYIDCRKIISYPRERARLMDLAVARIEREIGRDAVDVVAGGETAGIPFAAWIAERLTLPMVYVRKAPKGVGRMAQIEGDLSDGARALLVEDLATDAGSKVNFVNALRGAGARVSDAFVVFSYGIFPQAQATLAELDLRLHALATWWDILAEARAGEHFPAATLAAVEAYLRDPNGWTPNGD